MNLPILLLRRCLLATALSTALVSVGACAGPTQPSADVSSTPAATAHADRSPTPAASADPATPRSQRPLLVVTKNASCGCCGLWVKRMQQAGFQVQVHDTDNLDPIKRSVGVPAGKGSCHTAQIGGYFIEGHVPADDIKRLLTEKPSARGLVLPGMPAGSPGMETPGGGQPPYTVELVARDGSTSAFAQHGEMPGN